MTNNEIKTRIKQRYDTLANWESKNPILLEGEVARVRMDDNIVRTKTGDGTSAFNSLSWDDKNLYSDNTATPKLEDGNIVWGGKNREDSFGPIDAAMIPTLGANRFAFMPAEAIEVEYSRDGGVTWLNYEAPNWQKTSCFAGGAVQSGFAIGKSSSSNPTTANDQLRITLIQSKSNVYNQFYKFLLYISTNSSTGCKVTIQGLFGKDLADETAYKTFVDNIPLKSNWGGYTVINNFTPVVFGAGSNHYGKLRFIFTSDGITTPSATGLAVQNIYGFGGVGWKTPSNLAKFGYIYKWDSSQVVTFPNRVLSSNNPIGDSDLTNKKYVDTKFNSLTTDNLKNGSDTLILNGNWSF